MKTLLYTIQIALLLIFATSCEPLEDKIGEIGSPPSNGSISVDKTDPFNPVFTVTAEKGISYHWDMGNNQKMTGESVTAYYPFAGSYNVVCIIYGPGAQSITATNLFDVATSDPTVLVKPGWKELIGATSTKTWVYNTDPATGSPDYCFQTYWDLVEYPDHWRPENSWGQCVQITPDVKGEMVFDLLGGINYTYHHVAGDAGVKGSFIFDTKKMTITIVNPYILDYNIECTVPAVTATGIYQIKLLTDDEMVLWQNQGDGTGWSWSFKRKGYTP